VRRIAGADRWDGLVPAHAPAGRAARAAWVGGVADAVLSGWDDCGGVYHAPGRVESGRRGGVLPWGLLVAGSVASLAANVAVAEPTLIGRVIAAWPSFALTASYELLTRQVRRSAAADDGTGDQPRLPPLGQRGTSGGADPAPKLMVLDSVPGPESVLPVGRRELQRQAWQWALARQATDGALPTGREIARQRGRHERWGRLVKSAGLNLAGELVGHDLAEATADRAMPPPAAWKVVSRAGPARAVAQAGSRAVGSAGRGRGFPQERVSVIRGTRRVDKISPQRARMPVLRASTRLLALLAAEMDHRLPQHAE